MRSRDHVRLVDEAAWVAGWQHEGSPAPRSGQTTEQRLGTSSWRVRDVVDQEGEFVLLTDPHLVLAPHLYRCAKREFRADIRHAGGEVF